MRSISLLIVCTALLIDVSCNIDGGCKFHRDYEVNSTLTFKICVGQNDADLKNNDAIISLINSRGYLPTCRVLNLMLWMSEQIGQHGNGLFVEVGANIGSCTNHIASLGYRVYSIDPVPEHARIIAGSREINPSFFIHHTQGGASFKSEEIQGQLRLAPRNWGAGYIHREQGDTNITLISLDDIIKDESVRLLKLDCEGCEYAALLG